MNLKLWYEKFILNPIAQEVANDLRANPSHWCATDQIIKKNGTEFEIWSADGYWWCEIYSPNPQGLGLMGRHIVWRECKSLVKARKANRARREHEKNVQGNRVSLNQGPKA